MHKKIFMSTEANWHGTLSKLVTSLSLQINTDAYNEPGGNDFCFFLGPDLDLGMIWESTS